MAPFSLGCRHHLPPGLRCPVPSVSAAEFARANMAGDVSLDATSRLEQPATRGVHRNSIARGRTDDPGGDGGVREDPDRRRRFSGWDVAIAVLSRTGAT